MPIFLPFDCYEIGTVTIGKPIEATKNIMERHQVTINQRFALPPFYVIAETPLSVTLWTIGMKPLEANPFNASHTHPL